MNKKVLPGLNIQAPWARLLLEGKKCIETRTYALPDKYRGQELWLIETPGKLGKFRARVIGIICFSECKRYWTADEFYSDSDYHLIHPNTANFAWQSNVPKFGWLVASVRAVGEFEAPSPRGVVYAGPFERSVRT